MKRYHTIVKIERIRKELQSDHDAEALKLAKSIPVERLKSISDLSVIADAYFQNGEYETAKEYYKGLYEKSGSRRILWQLIQTTIRLKQTVEAENYLEKFIRLAPGDFYQYIFRYQLDRLEGRPLEERIRTLEKLKEMEYMEHWVYELAKLYHKAGEVEKCIKECEDLILWFGNGEYVERARALRAYYKGDLDVTLAGQDSKRFVEEMRRVLNGGQKETILQKVEQTVKKSEEEKKAKGLEEELQQQASLSEQVLAMEAESTSQIELEPTKKDSRKAKRIKNDTVEAEPVRNSRDVIQGHDHSKEADFKSNSETALKPSSETALKSGTEPVLESAFKSGAEPVLKPGSEPAFNSNSEPALKSSSEPASETIQNETQTQIRHRHRGSENLKTVPTYRELLEMSAKQRKETPVPTESKVSADKEENEKPAEKKAGLLSGTRKEATGSAAVAKKRLEVPLAEKADRKILRAAIEKSQTREPDKDKTDRPKAKEQALQQEDEVFLEILNHLDEVVEGLDWSEEETEEEETGTEEISESDKEESNPPEDIKVISEDQQVKEAKRENQNTSYQETVKQAQKPAQSVAKRTTNESIPQVSSKTDKTAAPWKEPKPEEEINVSPQIDKKQQEFIPEQDLSVQKTIAELPQDSLLFQTLKEKQEDFDLLFGEFSQLEPIRILLISNLERILKQKKARIIVSQEDASVYGIMELSKLLARALHRLGIVETPNTALIQGEKLNQMNLKKTGQQLKGCTLIVEHVGALKPEKAGELLWFCRQFGDAGVILTDKKEGIARLFRMKKDLNSLFQNKFYLRSYSVREWFTLACGMMKEDDYEISEAAKKVFLERLKTIMEREQGERIWTAIQVYTSLVMEQTEQRNAKLLLEMSVSGRFEPGELMVIQLEDIQSTDRLLSASEEI